MEPHVPTMLLMIVAVSATLSVSLAAGASRSKRDGLLLWSIGLATLAFAFSLFGMRGQISTFVLLVTANASISVAFALFAEGLFQFQQRPAPRKLIWFPVLILSISLPSFADNFPARVMLGSLIYSAQIILLLAALHQRRGDTVGRGQYLFAIGMTLPIPALVLRFCLAATGQLGMISMLAPSPVQALTLLVTIMAITLTGIGLSVMVKERVEEQNRLFAIQDQLTGLANRRRIDEVLKMEWARAKRSGSPLALVMLDVDLFKKFNDHYGHQAGDECLKSVARVLHSAAQRGGDLAARYGGEEFLLILPDTDAAAAQRLAQTVLHSILSLDTMHDQSPLGKVTVSAGIAAAAHGSYEDVESLLRAADVALYRAKQKGRNQVQIAPEPISEVKVGGKSLASFVQLVWRPAYECGNSVIDAQHRALFADANNLLAATLADKPAHEVTAYIDGLLREVVQHFNDEEAILAAAQFPDLAQHAAIHQGLVDRALDLKGRFANGTLGVGELFQFLAYDVVARHILGTDREFFSVIASTAAPSSSPMEALK